MNNWQPNITILNYIDISCIFVFILWSHPDDPVYANLDSSMDLLEQNENL